MDQFEAYKRQGWIKEAEAAGQVADSMDVRLDIIARIKSGDITLEQGQAELKRIQRRAKSTGKITRNQAFLGRKARAAIGQI